MASMRCGVLAICLVAVCLVSWGSADIQGAEWELFSSAENRYVEIPGAHLPGSHLEVQLDIVNNSPQHVTVDFLPSGCGCLAVSPEKLELDAAKSAPVVVRIAADNYVGPISTKTDINIHIDGKQLSESIPLHGMVSDLIDRSSEQHYAALSFAPEGADERRQSLVLMRGRYPEPYANITATVVGEDGSAFATTVTRLNADSWTVAIAVPPEEPAGTSAAEMHLGFIRADGSVLARSIDRHTTLSLRGIALAKPSSLIFSAKAGAEAQSVSIRALDHAPISIATCTVDARAAGDVSAVIATADTIAISCRPLTDPRVDLLRHSVVVSGLAGNRPFAIRIPVCSVR